MRVHTLEREQFLPHPIDEVFPFFADAHNLERITPPLLRFRVVSQDPAEMRVGTLLEYRLRLRGLPVGWLTRIEAWEPNKGFVDNQLVGPYRLWHHTHTFEGQDGGTLMRDVVRYAMPAWPFGELAMPLVRRDLGTIFDFRRDNLEGLIGYQARGPIANTS